MNWHTIFELRVSSWKVCKGKAYQRKAEREDQTLLEVGKLILCFLIGFPGWFFMKTR